MHILTLTEARAKLRDRADEFRATGKIAASTALRQIANFLSPGDTFQLDGTTWTVGD